MTPIPITAKYYFAYGSNLRLQQMRRRCPNSRYIGLARLRDYRWQINERGYANVVSAEGHWVDGLVYEIDGRDEAKLDVNEGVAKGAYTKKTMTVHLGQIHPQLYRRPTAWIVRRGGPAALMRGVDAVLVPHDERALVYISLENVVDSRPKGEYVDRINAGLDDARVLGMEEDYIVNCVVPFLPDLPLGHVFDFLEGADGG